MEETQFKLLKLLQERPEATQRELAEALGVSLGKTHYCLRALIDKGWVKARNFGRNPDKLGYAHLLTPRGIEAKARLALSFLKRKRTEYETLRAEIARLRREVAATARSRAP